MLPPLAEGDRLELKALRPEQKFTQPPPRFTEATLVKELEENGIGRPSTYASIIGVLQDRDYVNKIEGRFKPTALGMMITRPAHQELRRHHRRRVHAQPRGRSRQDRAGQDRLRARRSASSTRSSRKTSPAPARRCRTSRKGIKTDEVCDRCGSPMLDQGRQVRSLHRLQRAIRSARTRASSRRASRNRRRARKRSSRARTAASRWSMKRGRFGQFLACSGYPECKTTRKLIATKQGGLKAAKPDQILDEKCPRCSVEPRRQAGPLRRVHGVHELSRVQVHQAQDDRREVSRRTPTRAARSSSASRSAARCSSAARTIPTATSSCGTARSPRRARNAARRISSRRPPRSYGRQILCNNEDCDYARSEELPETA